jgi:hypothetical protein
MLVVRLLGGLTVTDDDVTLAAPRGVASPRACGPT